MLDSVFCYDGIDQLMLAGFLYMLVRFLRTGERRLWIWLGLIAGLACMTKVTILFLGPGFLVALLVSEYRRDLLTRWPWLGAALCLVVVSPYLLWEYANHWPTIEYWTGYRTLRMYHASLLQYLTNLLLYMGPFLLPLWIVGLYRIFRRLDGVNYVFLGLLFLFTLALMFALLAPARMLVELFMPLLSAGAVFVEERLAEIRWEKALKAVAVAYLVVVGILTVPLSLPILPPELMPVYAGAFKQLYQPIREFNAAWYYPPFLSGRLGWDQLVREVAGVYDGLPARERAVAGIYTDWYMPAGAIDLLGPAYGLPHAVSGFLTYYLWGPGYSWDVMIIVTSRSNNMSVFFNECELKDVVQYEYDPPVGQPYIYVCRKPRVSADAIWPSVKTYR